jgi:uncharacterized protein (UPF0335 family)
MARKRNRQDASPKIGENGAALTDDRKKQLAWYISEIERHEAEIAEIRADVKTKYESAKDTGFHTKAIRHVVKERKVAKDKREAFEAVVDVYKHALGMLSDLPLGQAATVTAATEAAEKAGGRRSRTPPTSPVEPTDTSDRPFALPAGAEEDELRVPAEAEG